MVVLLAVQCMKIRKQPAVDHRPFISNVDMAEDETYLDLFGLNGDGFKLTD